MADPTATPPGTARGCTSCGASNAPTARFCASCGASLPPLTPPGGSPNGLDALLDTGRQHLLLGHWEDAALAAEAVLSLEPDSPEGHHMAARARLKQGMAARAVNHAERAVALDPDNREYQTTLADAMSEMDADTPRFSPPAVAATIVAVLVFGLIALVMLLNRGPDDTRTAGEPALTPTGPASPFSQPPANAPIPQASRTPGVEMDRPRIPAPGVPSEDSPPRDAAAPSAAPLPRVQPALPDMSHTILPPASVDASPLQRFPEPTSAPPQLPPQITRPEPFTQPPNPPGVTAAPPAQPGGTIFGPSPSAPARTTEPNTTGNPFTAGGMEAAEPAPPAPAAPRPVPPAQSYVDRDYGAAIRSLSQRIAAGEATGVNYQQLAAAYASAGDRPNAITAYRNAEAAYRAEIQAGRNTDVARRGLRNTQMQLRLMGAG